MQKIIYITIILLFLQIFSVKAQDTLIFKGQFSNWLLTNSETELPIWGGSRYIPQLNYTYFLKEEKKLDFEASANIYGTLATNFADSLYADGNVKPYRLWARYSGKQFELRAGLQKLNFGSASMLRPLMWFDGMDSRDPLNLTDGVYGILGRYYFLNNANIWLWGLYGNEAARGWEVVEHNKEIPEFGGRFQFPLGNTEIGLSYHHQSLDASSLSPMFRQFTEVKENKIAFDIKTDWVIGLWFEGAISSKSEDLGQLTNQEMMTFGTDYTFGIGSGLYFAFEHLVFTNDRKAFGFEQIANFSALSATYPIGMFDNLGLMFYYDWTSNSVYNFINWQKQFNNISLHLMAFWNPENSALPTQNSEANLMGGKGIQIMFVFNH